MRNLILFVAICGLAACGGRESSADSPADSMGRRAADAAPVRAVASAQSIGDTAVALTSDPAGSPGAAGCTEATSAAPTSTAAPRDDAVELLRRVEQASAGIRTL